MNLWRWKCGLSEIEKQKEKENIKDLEISEWSNTFEKLMRNRLILGALRYGKMHAKNKSKYNRIESIKNRLMKYEITGNKEHLVDIANLCLMEFEECHHPKAHFNSIDDGEHVKEVI